MQIKMALTLRYVDGFIDPVPKKMTVGDRPDGRGMGSKWIIGGTCMLFVSMEALESNAFDAATRSSTFTSDKDVDSSRDLNDSNLATGRRCIFARRCPVMTSESRAR